MHEKAASLRNPAVQNIDWHRCRVTEKGLTCTIRPIFKVAMMDDEMGWSPSVSLGRRPHLLRNGGETAGVIAAQEVGTAISRSR